MYEHPKLNSQFQTLSISEKTHSIPYNGLSGPKQHDIINQVVLVFTISNKNDVHTSKTKF